MLVTWSWAVHRPIGYSSRLSYIMILPPGLVLGLDPVTSALLRLIIFCWYSVLIAAHRIIGRIAMFYAANERKRTCEHVDKQYMDIPCGVHGENRGSLQEGSDWSCLPCGFVGLYYTL